MARKPSSNAYRIAAESDPYLALLCHFGSHHVWNELFAGIDERLDVCSTRARSHSLIIGPPQSNKTVGMLIPQILCAGGPVVSTSTKDDVYRATCWGRARLGRLWTYSPDGAPPLPGTTPLYWSPIPASRDWSTALMLGKAMADAADASAGTENASFFRQKAGEMLAALLHAAGLGDKPMEWILEAVAENERPLREADRILRAAGGYSNIAADLLASIMRLDGRSRGSIITTTSLCVSAYRFPGALESTRVESNFDVDKFVRGSFAYNPETDNGTYSGGGFVDTIYITAGSEAQAIVAPLVVGLLARIRQARYDLHRQDQLTGKKHRPTFFALDEVANIAPLGELPQILAEGSSQGLLVSAVMQDLVQAKARWKETHEGFLTLFREVFALPGIRNDDTVEQLSQMSGEVWEESYSASSNWGREQSHGESVGEQRRVKYSPSEIYMGAAQDEDPADLDPRRMLVLTSTGRSDWRYAPAWYMSPPFAEGVMACLEHAAKSPGMAWLKRRLPLPELAVSDMHEPERAKKRWQRIKNEFGILRAYS